MRVNIKEKGKASGRNTGSGKRRWYEKNYKKKIRQNLITVIIKLQCKLDAMSEAKELQKI